MDRLRRIYLVAVRYTVFLNSALAIALWVLAYNILSLWIGDNFAKHGGPILALLALSALLDSFTNLPSIVNDGLGYPRVTGGFAVVRAAIGVGVVYVLVNHLGVIGAPIGQLAVSAVMSPVFIGYTHGRTVPVSLKAILLQSVIPALGCTVGPGLLGWSLARQLGANTISTVAIATVMATSMVALGYRYVLRSEDKALLRRLIVSRLVA